MKREELDVLILRHLSGELTPEEGKKLQAIVHSNPEAARRLLELADDELLFRSGVKRSVEGKEKKERRRSWKSLAGVAAALMVLAATYLLLRQGAPPALARVEKANGTVLRLPDRGPVSSGQDLLEGQGLETSEAGSSACLTYPDGTRLYLGPGTCLSNIVEGGQGKRITVLQGELRAEVARQPGGKQVTFTTPQGEVTVLGTTLRIVIDPDPKKGTRLEVEEGKVQLKNRLIGKTVDVIGGHYAVAAVGVELVSRPFAVFPENKWTPLPTKSAPVYFHAAPVYAPSRGQVFFWGRDGASGGGGETGIVRNDISAFDAASGAWISDVPSASAKELKDAYSAGLGVAFSGQAAMLPSGTPVPSTVSCGGTWDSKRSEIVYTVGGMTFAYNPGTKKWRDFKAEQAPMVYGPGAGYDPVNDEIVLFPHFNARNLDLARINGNVTSHQGTWIYSYKSNAWRRAGETFGSEEVRKARKALLELVAKVSAATDGAWTLRRTAEVAKPEAVRKGFAEAVGELDRLPMPAEAKTVLAKAAAPLQEASAASVPGKWDEALAAGGRALWVFDEALDKPLRTEPPARGATPLVYDPKNQCLVMFGGHTGLVRLDLQTPESMGGEPGCLNDTWIYDCKTRQWRDASKSTRPPPTLWPSLVYDSASGLVLLVTRAGNIWDDRPPRTIAIWGFDAAKAEWRQLDEQPWTGYLANSKWTGWGTIMQEVALDAKAGKLLLLQVRREGGSVWQETYALRLDVSKMVPRPAPAWKEPEPIRPHRIPPDDPAVVARLNALPANKWVHVRPSNDGPSRDWGNAACDPVRGHVYYFGGGHSTYQVNDVAVFAPGVNKWFYAAGDHNDWVPPAGWDGSNPGLRGGRNAHHQRNSYVALDGRMYSDLGAGSRRWVGESGKQDYQRYSWFYDVDRGGVWRQVPLDYTKEAGADGVYGGTHLAAPDGRVLGFGGGLEPYDGRFFPGQIYFAALDPFRNVLTVKKVAPGPVSDPNEDRPFCFLPDKNQVFFYEKTPTRQATWVYDVKTNAFIDLKPKRQPPGVAQTVEHINGQNAVFAVIRGGQQWVYSFKENSWAPLPLDADDPNMGFAAPYAQTVYAAKYRVLVNLGASSRGTAVMRPDFSLLKWD